MYKKLLTYTKINEKNVRKELLKKTFKNGFKALQALNLNI